MEIEIETVAFESPRTMGLRQEDRDGVFDVTYTLEPSASGTSFAQASQIDWKLPRLLQLVGNRMVPRHLDEQMRALKELLER